MFAQNKICTKFALALRQWEVAHGVMVTQLFLVQSFKVRVLVGQQKTPQPNSEEEFFILQ